MKIDKYSHYFKVSIEQSNNAAYLIKKFITDNYTQLNISADTYQEKVKTGKKYAGYTSDFSTFWFHIGLYAEVIEFLTRNNIYMEDVSIIEHPMFVAAPLTMGMAEGWVARDYQLPHIEHLINNDCNVKLLGLQTGKGKTFCAVSAITQIKQRCVIVVLPTYMPKWVEDIQTLTGSLGTDVMLVRGSSHLAGLIQLAQDGKFSNDFTIISARTMQNFIEAYEENPEETLELYGCAPDDLFEVLKAGVLLIDETHQHLHVLYKMFCHTNISKIIGLSATLLSDSYVVKKIQKLMYPPNSRMAAEEYDRYIDAYAVSYNISHVAKKAIRTEEYGSKFYSHGAFEKSILHSAHLTNQYIAVIKEMVDTFYSSEYRNGDKLAIYVYTKKMAAVLTDKLKNTYRELDVRKYTEEDPYENAIEPDIRVTTIISSGTAIDIPNLRVVLLTQAISSTVSNLQVMGRLRKLTDRDVKFVYIYSLNVGKHVEYHHKKKKEILVDKVKNFKELSAQNNIR